MNQPPDDQVRAGEIAKKAIALAKKLCKNPIQGLLLDQEIETLIRDEGGEPSLKGYHPRFADDPYKWTICLSLDHEVVHGIPDKVIVPEHMITVDLVVKYNDWHADTARTFTYSKDQTKLDFVHDSKTIFEMAKQAISPNGTMDLFGYMVEAAASIKRYGVIREYCGHGIGKSIHMPPQIVNYRQISTNIFKAGYAYAVEPVLAFIPRYDLTHSSDGYTVLANCLASHNEDTIFISEHKLFNLTGE